MEAAELAAKQLESVKDQFVRLTAEYDNYRKRTAKEKDNLYQDAKADTIKEFLAVYDNLERAAATEGGEDSPHKKGLEMIFHQYQEILGKLGVTEIPALGETFDPEKHNAVMHIDDENYGENVVAQVFQAGFMLGGPGPAPRHRSGGQLKPSERGLRPPGPYLILGFPDVNLFEIIIFFDRI